MHISERSQSIMDISDISIMDISDISIMDISDSNYITF
jgi:hypothetical protein